MPNGSPNGERAAENGSYGAQSMWAPLRWVLMKRPQAAFRSDAWVAREWQRYGYRSCPDLAAAERQFDAFCDLLARYVPRIDFMPVDDRAGLDSLYTHDPVKVTRRGAILLNPAKVLRQQEPAAMRDILQQLGVPILGSLGGEARMEGGDVVWLDDRHVALGRGYRTNDAGIRQFQSLLGDLVDDIVVVPLPHAGGPEACLHLMSVISLVDRDLAVVYSPYLPVFFRQYLLEHGYTLIEVPDHEYETLGSNVLALGPRRCVMLEGHPETARQLAAAGAEVLTYSGADVSWKGTGGPTCLTAPLWRENLR